jgi:glycosyltransferase 2 family protein
MDATSSTSPATASRGNSVRKALFALLRLAIGVAILVYLVKSGRVDLHSLTRVFRAWPLTLLGMAMLLIDMLFMSIRVSRLFHAQRLSLGLWNAIQLTLIGFFFSTFLPGAAGGDLAKLYYVTRENEGRRAEVATVLLFDRIIGLLSLVLIPFFFVPFFLELLRNAPTLRRILWLDAILGLGMCAAMASVMFSGKFRMALPKLLGRWQGLQNITARMLDAMAGYGKARGVLLGALILSFLANLALIGVTALGLYTVNPTQLSWKLCLVAPVGHLVNSVPLTPGGIGVGETAFNALFPLTGMTGGADALLCLRIWSLLVGALGLLNYIFGMGRIVHWQKDHPGAGQLASSKATSSNK